jgi:hypothetical protein
MAVVRVDRSRQLWSGTTVPCDQEDRDLFAAATTITLGDGNMARFRHSHWLEDKTRNKLAPAIFAASKRKNISVHNSPSMLLELFQIHFKILAGLLTKRSGGPS